MVHQTGPCPGGSEAGCAVAVPRHCGWVLLWYLPSIFILGWWIRDLQPQWSESLEYRYGWLVVVLAAYLVWERWPNIPKNQPPGPLWLCTLLVFLGAPFVFFAQLMKEGIVYPPVTSFLLSIGCTLFIAANLLYVGGRASLRHLLFPLLFIYVAVPLPPIIWIPIVSGLQRFITTLDVETLKLMGIPAIQQVNVIQLPNCVVGIDEACSGVRSLESSIMAALFIGDLTLKRVGSRLFLLVSGIVLALGGNFVRSLFLSCTAHYRGVDLLKETHDAAGWTVLIFTASGLILVAWLVARWEKWLETFR